MPTVMHLEASPRGERSFSSRAALAFIEAYRTRHPQDAVQHVPVFEAQLPEFDGEAVRQKIEHVVALRAGERVAPAGKWAAVVAEIDRLKAADKLIVSSPMWNFSIPYRLKLYLDIIVQPGLTFRVNAQQEHVGMIRDKPLQLILASGSTYPARLPVAGEGVKLDFQRCYLEHVFRYIGFEDIRVVKIEPTADATPEQVQRMFQEKLAEARLAGERF